MTPGNPFRNSRKSNTRTNLVTAEKTEWKDSQLNFVKTDKTAEEVLLAVERRRVNA